MHRFTTALILAVLAANSPHSEAATPAAPQDAATRPYAVLQRLEFNRRAVDYAVPLFWVIDANKDGAIDPAELAVTWGLTDDTIGRYVRSGKFTPEFDAVYGKLRHPVPADGAQRRGTDAAGGRPARALAGRPALVQTKH